MPGVAVGTVMLLCLLPVGTMITGSIIVTFFQPGPKLTSAMQHFAAGIVLAAVALELAPQTALMIHKQNGVFTIAMLLGFFAAIALLMVISRYFDADDEEDEKKDDDVKKEKEVEVFTSNPAIGAPATSFNLDIGSNKSTAYNSPASTPPRSPMEKDLDTNSMPGQMGGNQWEQSPPAYNNNNNWNNNNNNNWNNNNMNNNSRDRDNSFPSQIDRVRYGTVDNRDNASDVSASSYSNNSQSPLSRGGDSSSSVSGASRAPVSRNYNQGGYGNYNNNNGYGNNNNNWNNNNWNSNQRGPYPPPPAPPAMPAPEGDWNGGNNSNNWGNNNNNNGNWGNNNGNWGNNNNGNMYNSNNWNTRTRQRGVSQHTWQPRVRYAAQWKNQGRSDMGFVPPPPPRRNQGGMGMNNGGNQWGNNNPDLTQTHTRMPSYMLHGMASTGLAKSMQRKSINQPAPFTPVYNTTLNTDVSKPGTTAAPVGPFSMPWGIIVAVAVDASTDGILIGVASAVGQGGLVVALALAIEMTFLGISTSIEMTEANVPKYLQIPLLMILPCFVLVGGAIGSTVMAGVTGPLFVAFLSFGMAALLFLVTEELLIAAHEDLAHDTWYVSISFFVGFIIVLIMDQYSGPDMCADRINVASVPLINALQANGITVPPFGV